MTRTQRLDPPADTIGQTFHQLAYVEALDAVLGCDYAFLAYREVDGDGSWRVRIRSSQTAGAVFEPDAIRSTARACGGPWFPWGYAFDPSEADPRCIQFRVHVVDGAPTEVEILVQLRRADGTAGEATSVRFPWPA